MLLIDTSVLIDYFRKPDKEKTLFYELAGKYSSIAISAITKYEIMVGNTPKQEDFWQQLLSTLQVIAFADQEAEEAAMIKKELKQENKLIGFADIAIAATARVHDLEIATLNIGHFNRIKNLQLLSLKNKI
ncbi:MAG: type II toxin-antitoxin system VapC family toxin [Saprospiraceae bacterium]|nr:type II toxin-antitoxin system VapC family toxin [Saprospiraceae bacterium]